MKKRLLKYLGISLLLVGLAALWGFTHFFYNPFEGKHEGDLSLLIPRDVDFYVSKGRLKEDFAPFPRLAVSEAFQASKGGQALARTEGWKELMAGLDLEASLAEVDRALAQAPVEIDPLDLFGGEDLAVAGYFRGRELAEAEWAAYARLNWMGKFAVEMLDSGFADTSAQGLVVAPAELEGETLGISLSGGQLPRPVYLTRIQDVAVLASSPQLLARALELEAGRGQDSLYLSGKYSDNIGSRLSEDRDEFEVYVDQRTLLESLQLPGTWPDPKSPEVAEALFAKLFQLGSVRELLGSVKFGSNVKLDLTAELSSDLLTPVQKKLYREGGFDQNFVLEVARVAPVDTALFVYGHVDLGDLLREAVSVLDESTLGLIEDGVRSVWGYSDVYPLIDDLDACFRDRFALYVRDHDYGEETGASAPLSDGQPVPAWGFLLFLEDAEKFKEIQQRVQSHARDFGIQGRDGSAGIYTNTPGGVALVTEYHNPLVPGTGHVATMQDTGSFRDGEAGRSRSLSFVVISNENRLLGQSYFNYQVGGADYPSLLEDPYFSTWVRDGLPSSNLLLWWRPEHLEPTLKKLAQARAELDILDAIDWSVERPRIEREVLARDFPGQRQGAVSPELQDAVDARVDAAVEAFGSERTAELLPTLQARYAREVEAWSLLSAALLQLRTDPKELRLAGRLGYRFDS